MINRILEESLDEAMEYESHDETLAVESESSDVDSQRNLLFNIAIATIFAREFLEGAIIIGQYRTVIYKQATWDDERKTTALKTVTKSALGALFVAILVVLAVAIPLGVLSQQLDEKAAEIIEGISKVIAAICILQLSVKIPVWLGIYWKVSIFPHKNQGKNILSPDKDVESLSQSEIRFNVAWNIWREAAECGVFLIPFFLGDGAIAIPLSAIAGIAVALVVGFAIYFANHRMKSKTGLAFFMSGLTMMLAVGLFVGGCHEFEEVWGMTKNVYKITNPRLSHKSLPMVILKPFGYSSSRSVLQITCFWCSLAFGLFIHFLKWNETKKAKANYVPEEVDEPVKDVENGNTKDEFPAEESTKVEKSIDERSSEEEARA